MRSVFFLLCFTFSVLPAFCQVGTEKTMMPDSNKKILIVDAACGQCKLGLTGKSCDLAIRIKGQSYFVDGTAIDSHGDAHAKDGFCNAIRKAEVQGEIVDNRFKATYFKLIPANAKKEKVDKP